jgi:acetyl-CoA C-acetyltransferase
MPEGPVRVRSSALASGVAWDHRSDDLWGSACVRRAARAAMGAAGVGPGDVDVVEAHDAFTIGEVATLEALGLAAPGKGADLAVSGRSALGGEQPVNPSGGLLSRGHPLGATGLAQVAELCWQLTGRAGDRQVPGARTALVETMGGGASGVDGNACVVAVLERS